MVQRRQPRRRIDADGAWKRVLSELLAEFVAFALPELYTEVDWSREPVFLEQELRSVLRQAAAGRRVADLVVQLWLRDGRATWLLAHVEVQGKVEPDFAERMYAYATLLYLHYRGGRARRQTQEALPPPPSGIVGVAILTDSNVTWRPGDFHWGWGDFGIHYRYRVLKLADWRAQGTELVDDPRLFAWVIRTWLAVRGAGRMLDAQATVQRNIGRAVVGAQDQVALLDLTEASLALATPADLDRWLAQHPAAR